PGQPVVAFAGRQRVSELRPRGARAHRRPGEPALLRDPRVARGRALVRRRVARGGARPRRMRDRPRQLRRGARLARGAEASAGPVRQARRHAGPGRGDRSGRRVGALGRGERGPGARGPDDRAARRERGARREAARARDRLRPGLLLRPARAADGRARSADGTGRRRPGRRVMSGRSVLLLLLLGAAAARAETLYVTDMLRLGLHRASDTSDSPFTTLVSGTALEVLERTTYYARVRTPDGTEGWVKATYLVAEPPARARLHELEAEVERLKRSE